MEVHHLSPSPRKRWSHYVWEFLMLFLAVFCGFLAENQREHFVEHRREKQFMASLVEDLQTDTAELLKAWKKTEIVGRYSDSVVGFLINYEVPDQIPQTLAYYVGLGGQNLSLITSDRTSSQLKNSGAMRLIRKQEVSDAILMYWKQIDETNISINRYQLYRNDGRELLFKLWVIPDVYKKTTHKENQPIQLLRVIDKDPKKWAEFTNLFAITGTLARHINKNDLEQQLEMAKNLIALIREKYHLEQK